MTPLKPDTSMMTEAIREKVQTLLNASRPALDTVPKGNAAIVFEDGQVSHADIVTVAQTLDEAGFDRQARFVMQYTGSDTITVFLFDDGMAVMSLYLKPAQPS